jgi:hypothetical protein
MYFLFENLLAARGSDENVWVQFIVIAAIVGFSVLQKIIRGVKTASEQKSDQSKYNPIPTKPKKRYVAANGSYKTLEQLREEKKAQIRAAFGIPEPPPIVVETPQVVEKIEKPVHYPKPESQPVYTAPPPQEVYAEAAPSKVSIGKISKKQSRVSASSQTPAGTGYKLLFSSPQDLRTAILYQEILGKPLALRDAV